MVLLERALRIFTSRGSWVLPASSVCSCWTSPTSAAGSPVIVGLALVDPDLRGPVGGACVDYPRNKEYAHAVRIAMGFPMLRGCEVPGSDIQLSSSSIHRTSRVGKPALRGSMCSSHLSNIRRSFSSYGPEDVTSHLPHVIGPSLLEKEVLLPHSSSDILPGKEVLLQVPPINQLDYIYHHSSQIQGDALSAL